MSAQPPPDKWKDCLELCPSPEEIVEALQDPGAQKKVKKRGKEQLVTKFPLVEKIGTVIHKKMLKVHNKPDGMDTNSTRGKIPLCIEIIQRRHHVDISETDVFFHPHGKQGNVFIITNNPDDSGIDLAIDGFQQHCIQAMEQKNAARTEIDGVRLACVLLDPEHRSTVAGLMSRKKDRKKSDVTGDPALNFHQLILHACFLNTSCVVAPPDDGHCDAFLDEDKAQMDPNHFSFLSMKGMLHGSSLPGRSA